MEEGSQKKTGDGWIYSGFLRILDSQLIGVDQEKSDLNQVNDCHLYSFYVMVQVHIFQ
jgi:hypothetical protein